MARYYFHVTHSLVREKSYALALLYLKASEYTHLDKRPFKDIFGVTSRAALQEYALIEEIAAIDFAGLVEFIDLKGKRRFPDPTDNARKLHQVVQDSYLLPEAFQQPLNTILALSFKHITSLQGYQKRLKTAVADQLEAIPHTVQNIPGIGPVFSAGIISEIGPWNVLISTRPKWPNPLA